ncbi:MAG: hypothetical protein AUI14_17160 [Actinobacteria bacterium 13_2_20CM_2_71_6]|nr:MAG: hypothetical protein AUI14_17160 [Actinobacteria bacterium 13_2_20CM_2_71_6]
MTTLAPSEPGSAASALRIPPIAANLLPQEIVESRRARRVRRLVVSALAVVVVLLAGWYGLASYETAAARSGLAGAESEAQRLVQQQHNYAELVGTQTESKAITAQLATLLADDLQWSHLITSLQQAAPGGVQVTGVTGVLATAANGGGATTRVAGTTEKPVGTLTVTGVGGTNDVVAAYVDALGKVCGLANPLLAGATQAKDGVQFTVRLDITKAALGGRHTPKDKNGSGAC